MLHHFVFFVSTVASEFGEGQTRINFGNVCKVHTLMFIIARLKVCVNPKFTVKRALHPLIFRYTGLCFILQKNACEE